jgi:hypothetical protein
VARSVQKICFLYRSSKRKKIARGASASWAASPAYPSMAAAQRWSARQASQSQDASSMESSVQVALPGGGTSGGDGAGGSESGRGELRQPLPPGRRCEHDVPCSWLRRSSMLTRAWRRRIGIERRAHADGKLAPRRPLIRFLKPWEVRFRKF